MQQSIVSYCPVISVFPGMCENWHYIECIGNIYYTENGTAKRETLLYFVHFLGVLYNEEM